MTSTAVSSDLAQRSRSGSTVSVRAPSAPGDGPPSPVVAGERGNLRQSGRWRCLDSQSAPPNLSAARPAFVPEAIVLHRTGGTRASFRARFKIRASSLSAHYLVARDGPSFVHAGADSRSMRV